MRRHHTISPTRGSRPQIEPGSTTSEFAATVATRATTKRIVITRAIARWRRKLRWRTPMTTPSENSIPVKRLLPLQSRPTMPTIPRVPRSSVCRRAASCSSCVRRGKEPEDRSRCALRRAWSSGGVSDDGEQTENQREHADKRRERHAGRVIPGVARAEGGYEPSGIGLSNPGGNRRDTPLHTISVTSRSRLRRCIVLAGREPATQLPCLPLRRRTAGDARRPTRRNASHRRRGDDPQPRR